MQVCTQTTLRTMVISNSKLRTRQAGATAKRTWTLYCKCKH